ncbi:hypothetical protein ACIA8F_09245 [Streptomyces sp. NPDC051563]|uniref:hypothetical protein n=1 Tax=Streptomyces sp. NPDC051563 TaxID=3365659 RepID=UPI0037AB47F0
MRSAPSEPELPDRVPEKRDALTPDLPPIGPGAPDLIDTGKGRKPRADSGHEQGDRPAAGPGNAAPEEPAD